MKNYIKVEEDNVIKQGHPCFHKEEFGIISL
jgi:hypothetical protein